MSTQAAVSLIAAFALGSLPFGWLIAKLWGVADLRKEGSANVGATNVVRSAGWVPGAITFLLDFGKGIIPMLFFPEATTWTGLAAVLGHCYSPILMFRGGKGVSTTLGALVALNPWLGGASILAYGFTLAVLRVSALGSLFAMLTGLAGVILFGDSDADKLAVGLLVLIVLGRHRDNWDKLLGAGAAFVAGVILSLATEEPARAARMEDFRGKPVRPPVAAKAQPARVAALMPNLAELVVDLDAADRLVAAPEYARLPDAIAARVRRVGPYNRVSIESVLAAKPDLVLASMDGNDRSAVDRLEALGLRVLTVQSASLADIVRSMELVATAIGAPTHPALARARTALLDAGSGLGARQGGRRKVFVQVGWEPLVTIGRGTFVDELVSRAGGDNIFADSAVRYPRPSPEEVLARNPEVVVICQLTDDGREADKARTYWLRFGRLAAVRDGRVHVIRGDWLTKPGLTLLKGLDELRRVL